MFSGSPCRIQVFPKIKCFPRNLPEHLSMFGLKENMKLMQPFTDNIKEEITLI